MSRKVTTSIHSRQKISALPHQEAIVKHMNITCKNQKGMILYHHMGTGKTITALYFLKNYIDTKYKRLLICPDELVSVWEKEIEKLHLSSGIFHKIITYSKIQQILDIDTKKYILVMDEAHHIVSILTSDKNKARSIINKLQDCYRNLLLTGTPIYNKETDMLYLLNITAGKQVVPYQESKFKDQFFKIKITDAVTKGWILKLLSNNFFGKSINVIQVFYLISKMTEYLSYILKIPASNKWIKSFVDVTGKPTILTTNAIETLMKPFHIPDIFTPLFIPIFTIVVSLIAVIASQYDTYKIDDFYQLDHKKFKKLSYYISYYSINETSLDFPKVKYITKFVEYSISQLHTWTGALLGEFDSSINDDDDDLFENISSEKEYINKGRIIGNLSDVNKFPDKFYKILNIIKSEQAVVYSNFFNKGSLKFSKFLDENKILHELITPYMTKSELEHSIELLKNKKIQVLILHPKFTEGISIQGARQMHIMEPIIERSREEQLVGRVVRYKSHEHLPVSDRNVIIYRWVCKADKFVSAIKRKAIMFKKWNSRYKAIPPMYLETRFKNDITPDMLITKRSSNLSKYIRDIEKGTRLVPIKCAE